MKNNQRPGQHAQHAQRTPTQTVVTTHPPGALPLPRRMVASAQCKTDDDSRERRTTLPPKPPLSYWTGLVKLVCSGYRREGVNDGLLQSKYPRKFTVNRATMSCKLENKESVFIEPSSRRCTRSFSRRRREKLITIAGKFHQTFRNRRRTSRGVGVLPF